MDQEQGSKSTKLLLTSAGIISAVILFICFIVIRQFYLLNKASHQNGNLQSAQAIATANNLTLVPIQPDAQAPVLGQLNSAVTILEFADFQCPFCKNFHDTVLPGLKQKYIDQGKAKLIFQDLPILGPESIKAAESAKCVQAQGTDKFWAYHDLLYQNQAEENSGFLTSSKLAEFAKQVGVDTSKYADCVKQDQFSAFINSEKQKSDYYGLNSTPTIFINGIELVGVQPPYKYDQIIDELLALDQTKP